VANARDKQSVDQVIAAIVKLLYEVGAMGWPMQDKGALLAAIKLQLAERKIVQETKDGT